MNKIKSKQGFTLIEILIVIAIIGILASVAIIGLGGSRVKARDSKKISELAQIRNGLELYFTTCGHYPGGGAGCTVTASLPDTYNNLRANMVAVLPSLSNMPADNVNMDYGTNADNTQYVLGVKLEEANSIIASSPAPADTLGVDCNAATFNYCIGS